MRLAQELFKDGGGALHQWFWLIYFSLLQIQPCQTSQTSCGIRMACNESLFPDGQGLPVECFCLRVLSSLHREVSQSVQRSCRLGVVLAQVSLPNDQGSLIEGFCLLIFSLFAGERSEPSQGTGFSPRHFLRHTMKRFHKNILIRRADQNRREKCHPFASLRKSKHC